MADSPKYLMTQSRETEAVAVLKFFRGYAKSDENFSREFLDDMTWRQLQVLVTTEKLKSYL
jgi:hypothetical protein